MKITVRTLAVSVSRCSESFRGSFSGADHSTWCSVARLKCCRASPVQHMSAGGHPHG